MPIDAAIAILSAFTVYIAGGLFLIEPRMRSRAVQQKR